MLLTRRLHSSSAAQYLWVLALTACFNEATTEPPTTPGVYVAGVVRHQDGTPVRGITVVWELWPAPDSVVEGAIQDKSVRWFMQTDSLGRFAAHAGFYSVTVLDSITVGVEPGGCWGLAPLSMVERAVMVNPARPDTVFNGELRPIAASSPARLVVGPACAVIVQPREPILATEDRLAIWIDEISDSVRGRWRMNFQASRGDDYGRFSGWRAGSLLTLDLRHDTPWRVPGGAVCAGYTVEIPLEENDRFGIATYGSSGCPFDPAPLRFVEGEWLSWPFE